MRAHGVTPDYVEVSIREADREAYRLAGWAEGISGKSYSPDETGGVPIARWKAETALGWKVGKHIPLTEAAAGPLGVWTESGTCWTCRFEGSPR